MSVLDRQPYQHPGGLVVVFRCHGPLQVRQYPVRVMESNGRFKVSKFDLLAYLGAVPRDA
jgi:hypothetical protein